MKFCISRTNLSKGIATVKNIVSSRSVLPILSNALLQATNDEIELTTTDLDTSIRIAVKAQIDVPGTVTLPARRLFDIADKLPTEDVCFSVDKDTAVIRSGSCVFKILGLPAEEFPTVTRVTDAKEFSVTQKSLGDALGKIFYAASTDASRYIINSLLFSFKDKKITLVATDGRRLALVDHALDSDEAIDAVVPIKAIMGLRRLIGDDGDVTIRVGKECISFELNDTELKSKLIEGAYPEYKKVIPSTSKESVALDRESFLNAIRRVSLLTSPNFSSIKLSFTKNNIDLTACTPDVGESKESVPVTYTGRDFSISFNHQYLKEPLERIKDAEVTMDFTDDISPGVIKDSGSLLYVLMPTRSFSA